MGCEYLPVDSVGRPPTRHVSDAASPAQESVDALLLVAPGFPLIMTIYIISFVLSYSQNVLRSLTGVPVIQTSLNFRVKVGPLNSITSLN